MAFHPFLIDSRVFLALGLLAILRELIGHLAHRWWLARRDKAASALAVLVFGHVVLFTIWLSFIAPLIRQAQQGAHNTVSFYTDPDVVGSVFALVLLLTACRGGTEIIRKLLRQLGKSPTIGARVLGVGRTIGNLERMLIFLFAIDSQISAVGLVLAAKSLARFKELSEDRAFAEYYLIGTLASALIALATAYLARWAWILLHHQI